MCFYNKQKRKFEFYPKAFERRVHGQDPSIVPTRRKLLKLSLINFIILQALFLCLFAYIYGSLYQETKLVDSLNVIFVDYDGGLIGTAIRNAYSGLRGSGFPNLIEQTPQQYADQTALYNAICQADFWGAIFVSAGASTKYDRVLTSGVTPSSYNRSDVLTYIWDEARYSTVADSAIAQSLMVLSDAAKGALLPLASAALAKNNTPINLNWGDQSAVAVISQPWQLQSINIKPTTQGSRLIYNTLFIVLLLIQDFFYLGTMNGLYAQFNMYARLFPRRIIIYRLIVSGMYTFVGSLCAVSMIHTFRAGWQVNGHQFVEAWMLVWLFAHINFLTLDVFTVWLPPPYIPMALITWVVFNVTSVLLPFELSNSFYRLGYVFPAHAAFAGLIDIWSGGCYPRLKYALPVLFVLWLSSFLLSSLGVYRRCHYAVIAEEHKEKEFKERISTAIAIERKQERRTHMEASTAKEEGSVAVGPESAGVDADSAEDRNELEAAMTRVVKRQEAEDEQDERHHGVGVNYEGICFPLFDPEQTRTGLSRARTAG
jgi:hypothetical protein